MSELKHKQHQASQRKGRVRAVVFGTSDRPRLSVHISNRHIIAQIVNDQERKTLAYATTVGAKLAKGTLTEHAAWVGSEVAKKAKAAKVKSVVFDRGGHIYHGRVAALAASARQEGLEF